MTSEERITRVSTLTGVGLAAVIQRLADVIWEDIPGVTSDEMTKGTIVALRLGADMLEATMQVEGLDAMDATCAITYKENLPFHLADVERNVL